MSGPGFVVFIAVVFVVYAPIVAVSITVASRKGYNQWLWLLFSLYLPLIALIVALVLPVRPEGREKERQKRGKWSCPGCGEAIPLISQQCPRCGADASRQAGAVESERSPAAPPGRGSSS
jgi:hypothetical protein